MYNIQTNRCLRAEQSNYGWEKPQVLHIRLRMSLFLRVKPSLKAF